MTDVIRTLLWWNRGATPATQFWHEAARDARIVTIDELGGVCRIAIQPPRGVRMTSLLPSELSFLEHAGRPDVLADALARLLGEARSMRVLVADAIDQPVLFAAAVATFRPDVMAASCVMEGEGVGWPSIGGTIRCGEARRPVIESLLRDSVERARRRDGATSRYRVDELACFGLQMGGAEAPLPVARLLPGRDAALLVPGCGGGAVRFVPHFLAEPAPASMTLWLRVDGCELQVRAACDPIEAVATHLSPSTCHLLEMACDGPVAGRGLVGVEIGPAH